MKNTFQKPRIVVSKCLEFDKCRYDGQMIPVRFVRRLQKYVEFIPICPEVEIGLGIPRDPIKLIDAGDEVKLFQPATNRDLTKPMKSFSSTFLSSLKNIDGFILKLGSPSCGVHNVKIYHSETNPTAKSKGSGMFAAEVMKQYGALAIEDEGRLTNFRVREHFLTKIFIFALFRSVKDSKKVSVLVEFQTQNKFLIMAYSQKHMKKLGQIVAGTTKENFSIQVTEYEIVLRDAFKKNARYNSHINVLMHALGYFRNDLQANEKKYVLDMFQKYNNETIPLSAILSVFQSWIIKYDKEYLLNQSYFNPFPEELIEITDSGKGRNGK
jgi:uncharacterized protein YbgA (DUF1722 family)/uncharacterized protein YbbK (DUF523 family)